MHTRSSIRGGSGTEPRVLVGEAQSTPCRSPGQAETVSFAQGVRGRRAAASQTRTIIHEWQREVIIATTEFWLAWGVLYYLFRIKVINKRSCLTIFHWSQFSASFGQY